MNSISNDKLGVAAGIKILVLIAISIFGAVTIKTSRSRQNIQEQKAEEEGRLRMLPKRVATKPPQLPRLKIRSSLSMSSSPTTLKSPGTCSMVTTPSHRNRKRGSIDSLPSVETVLEQYEQEADAAEQHGSLESTKMLTNHDLGELGPSISTDGDIMEGRESARGRPDIGKSAIILSESKRGKCHDHGHGTAMHEDTESLAKKTSTHR